MAIRDVFVDDHEFSHVELLCDECGNEIEWSDDGVNNGLCEICKESSMVGSDVSTSERV
jgi:hypothetical protein